MLPPPRHVVSSARSDPQESERFGNRGKLARSLRLAPTVAAAALGCLLGLLIFSEVNVGATFPRNRAVYFGNREAA